MRHQGKITDWSDDRGFGFVTPNGGGTPVFVHIKAFARAGRRPLSGDLVNYDLGRDERGRECAQRVEYPRSGQRTTPRAQPGGVPLALVIMFFAILIVMAFDRLPMLIVALYAASSALSFAFYAWDKKSAQAGGQRIPEDGLHFLSLACGWPGALLAQRYLRHKSVKQPFRTVYWITVIVNIGVLVYVYLHAGELLR